MSSFEARHIIEALRQGVPSRAVGRYFSDSRPGIMKRITESMEKITAMIGELDEAMEKERPIC